MANLIITNLKVDSQNVVKALGLMHKNIELTGLGQLDDISQSIGRGISQVDILRMYKLKSGYYTFVNPLQIGVVLAGATDDNLLKEIEVFGINAGVAFQLKDDVLGLYGNPIKMGKPVADDIKAGKFTLLIERCLNLATKKDARFVQSKLGDHNLSSKDIEQIKNIVKDSDALKFVEDEIKNYANKAKATILGSTFWSQNTQALLAGLVEFSTERTN
jgi:geranylgeranyl diphosphate synthase, type I